MDPNDNATWSPDPADGIVIRNVGKMQRVTFYGELIPLTEALANRPERRGRMAHPMDTEIAELCDKLALVIRETEHPGGWMRREDLKVKIARQLGELIRKRFPESTWSESEGP